MRRIALIPLLLVALLGAAMVWSGEGRVSKADFSFINRQPVMSLDLNDMSYAQDIRVANGLWEGLLRLSPYHPQPIFGAADEMKLSADHRVYTIHIRPDARWSNGDPVLANDFLFAWRRMLESPKEYTYLHFYIKGASAYCNAFAAYAMADKNNKPPRPDFATVGERKIDNRTIEITLTAPVPYFPSILAFVPFYPLNEASMADFKEISPATGMTSYRAEFTRPPNLVTNGPYRLSEWAFHQRMRFVANEYYWNKANVKCKTIDQLDVDDPLARYRIYQQGDADWIVDVDGDIAAELLKHPERKDLHIFPGFGTYFYEINCLPKLPDGTVNPLHDPRVRQALAMTIDKVPIIRDVAKLHQPIARTYVPIGAFPGYHAPPGIEYNVEGAKRLLADAGYPAGKGFPRISILFNTTGIHADIATIIRRQWSNSLGIEVEARGEEGSQYRTDLHNHVFAVAETSWAGDYNDPSTFSDKYLSTSENNSAAWADERYDNLCKAAAVEADPTKRFNLLSQAEDRLLSEAPIIPIYTQVSSYLFHDNVEGITMNPQQIFLLDQVQVK